MTMIGNTEIGSIRDSILDIAHIIAIPIGIHGIMIPGIGVIPATIVMDGTGIHIIIITTMEITGMDIIITIIIATITIQIPIEMEDTMHLVL